MKDGMPIYQIISIWYIASNLTQLSKILQKLLIKNIDFNASLNIPPDRWFIWNFVMWKYLSQNYCIYHIIVNINTFTNHVV